MTRRLHRSARLAARLAVVLAALATAATAAPAMAANAAADPGDPVPVTACETHLSEPGSYVLAADLTCPSADGVWIDGDDVSLDLAGHTIVSDDAAIRIGLNGAVARARVTGPGTVTGVQLAGVDLARASDSTITGVTATGSAIGFYSRGTSHDVVWSDLDAHGNGTGLAIPYGTANTVRSGDFSDNRVDGIALGLELDYMNDVVVSGNTVQDNGRVGIYAAYWTTDALISDNVSTGNETDVQDDSCRGNVWARNIYVTVSSGQQGDCLSPLPVVTGLDRTAGPVVGGDRVVVTGGRFTGATQVTFGGVRASYTVDSDSQITAVAPAHAAGTTHVVVRTPSGRSATGSRDAYVYRDPPAVSGVSPASGPVAGGTKVTLTGSGFTGATSVRFGAVAGTAVTAVGDRKITVVAPAGTATGAVTVRVVAPGGTSAAAASAARYTYLGTRPVITGLSPSRASTAGGETIVVSGSGFLGATKVYVNGPATRAAFTVLSDTSIRITTPAHGAGATHLFVAGPGGTSNGAALRYVAPATG